MTALRPFVVLAAVCLTASPALARHRHHPVVPAPAGYPQAYWGGWQAEVIAHATQRMQDAPGVTNELAPDAMETATGGPSGGVPGFSGH